MKSIYSWFARNGVAANLTMVLLVVLGLKTVSSIKQEVFPEFTSDLISISVLYPGAAPEEVEEGVVIRIEERLQGLDGIDKMRSTANENQGTVLIEIVDGFDADRLLNDVKARVDAIDTFPEEAEEPVIEEVNFSLQVIEIALYGDAEEKTLKRLVDRMRDDLSALPEISQVELAATRPYEITIEVSEEALRRFELTFSDVANAVRSTAIDLPGGRIDSRDGEILLRSEGQVYDGDAFARLPLLTTSDGTRLEIGDVANVIDGFADADRWSRFDGKPAAILQVFRIGEQNAIEVATAVYDYLDDLRERLPTGLKVTTYQDETTLLRGRLSLLARNGIAGFILVFVVLALFLRLSLAGWVALGIPISFLGGVALMPSLGVSINMISLFGFIVVLGIVVDDAIVVGENIYAHFQRGASPIDAAINGASEVSKPVIFAVLTTIAAFAPILNVPGIIGKFIRVIPLVVIATLIFSLVESLLILPNHLSHTKRKKEAASPPLWRRVQLRVSKALQTFIETRYRPLLDAVLRHRFLSLAYGVGALTLTAALVASGWIQFNFIPPVESDNVVAGLTMPLGTPVEVTDAIVRRIEDASVTLEEELEEEHGAVFRHKIASAGGQPFRTADSQRGGNVAANFSAPHLGEVNIELEPSENRSIGSREIAQRWRELTGEVPEAVELSFSSTLFSSGEPINIELAGPSVEELKTVSQRLQEALRTYPGVQDISDSFRAGKRELEIEVTPEAEAAGISQASLARQVRQAFYGEEAQRIQRGRDDIKVMVRYPEARRQSLEDLEQMRVRGPGGVQIPLATAAKTRMSRGPAIISRTDRERVINVTADVDTQVNNPNSILADFQAGALAEILQEFPSVHFSLAGEQEQQRQTISTLGSGFAIALLAIYALLAIPFRSYLQPIVVMSAIPFGLIGAVLGHLLLGEDLTMLSMFGIVALTGVVINDSLVLVDFINREVESGQSVPQAIRRGGEARFRAILLTSLTTFAGLTPLLLERSLQARFLIPMAISLAFGVLFATVITLLLVPVLYNIVEDLRSLFRREKSSEAAQELAPDVG